MHKWTDSPVVTFLRGGREVELGRDGDAPVLHLYGSTGLGVAPVDVSKSDRLSGDGSIVRGVRYTDRELFVPLFVEQSSTGDLNTWRRDLTRVLAPRSGDPVGSLVDVRIEDPTTGSVRIARGICTGGLEGDYGDGYHGSWQTLGLTFDCSDPWWLGPERVRTLRINPGSKPFLSDTVPFFPVVLAESFAAGEWTVNVEGDAPVYPTWEVTGPGEDLLIESGGNRIYIDGVFSAGEVVRINTGTGRITPDRWDDVSLDSTLFPLEPGSTDIKVSLSNATTDTTVRLVWQERYLEGV